jgi:hypothetical protein
MSFQIFLNRSQLVCRHPMHVDLATDDSRHPISSPLPCILTRTLVIWRRSCHCFDPAAYVNGHLAFRTRLESRFRPRSDAPLCISSSDQPGLKLSVSQIGACLAGRLLTPWTPSLSKLKSDQKLSFIYTSNQNNREQKTLYHSCRILQAPRTQESSTERSSKMVRLSHVAYSKLVEDCCLFWYSNNPERRLCFHQPNSGCVVTQAPGSAHGAHLDFFDCLIMN